MEQTKIKNTTDMGKKYGFSFSWKRALGISAAKGRISRATGIPLTRAGRQRKVGRALGCCVILVGLSSTGLATGLIIRIIATG